MTDAPTVTATSLSPSPATPAQLADSSISLSPPRLLDTSLATEEIPTTVPEDISLSNQLSHLQLPSQPDDRLTTADKLKQLTQSLREASEKSQRMPDFKNFEPYSLPVSRVPSHTDESQASGVILSSSSLSDPASQSESQSHPGPRPVVAPSVMTSPPLTPGSTDKDDDSVRELIIAREMVPTGPWVITPRASGSQELSLSSSQTSVALLSPGAQQAATALSESDSRASTLVDDEASIRAHRKGMFSVGPTTSRPVSRDSSPSRVAASQLYSKPMTPRGEPNDPYAANKRPPQIPNPTRHSIDSRFVFNIKKRHTSSAAGTAFKQSPGDDLSDGHAAHSRHGSMADLKRVFKRGHSRPKQETPPAHAQSHAKTPTGQGMWVDEQALSSKYGKLGEVLGSGAGGSVRLMKRRDDGTVFAVKEFRARHQYETEKEYNKKVTAEFCIGSTLHHGNIIETLDIVFEHGRWYEVMEYAPFDLFAIVMTGRMTSNEITCCFLQILNGVTYLHSLGLAHRDLKLDNIVVSKDGIMKIIDFGSAHVFKYPFENGVARAKGVVGSDPYLAPEVYDARDYDAQAADIWSLGVIYSCMTLRHFPWKIPRQSDNSFRLFSSEPTPGHDPKHILLSSKSTGSVDAILHHHHHHHHRENDDKKSHDVDEHKALAETAPPSSIDTGEAPATAASSAQRDKRELIKGPWRILRLLPRESRYIIGRMLELQPDLRSSMDEILDEAWIADSVICQQAADGTVTHAPDHSHTLEPPISQAGQA